MRQAQCHWVFSGIIFALIVLQCLHSLELIDIAYRRSAIQSGEWWRLVTGQYVHNNLAHLLMNVIGLVIIYTLASLYRHANTYIAALVLTTPALGLALFYFEKDLEYYVGISGVLHGVLVALGIVFASTSSKRLGYLLVFSVSVKVYFEYIGVLSVDNVQQAIGIPVCFGAHHLGVISGVVLAFVIVIWMLSNNSNAICKYRDL